MTELKVAALKLHRIHKIVKTECKSWDKWHKYVKKGYFDENKDVLQNRYKSIEYTKELLEIERRLVADVQSKVLEHKEYINDALVNDGLIGLFEVAGILFRMTWDLITGLLIGW